MYVKILKSSDSEYWYSGQIGKVFEVTEELENDYRLYDINGFGMTISKEDCKEITREELILDKVKEYKYLDDNGKVLDQPRSSKLLNSFPADVEWLLQRLHNYETALKKIDTTETLLQAKFFAVEALKEE